MLQSLLFEHTLSECINVLVVGGSKIVFGGLSLYFSIPLLVEIGNVSTQLQELWYMTPECMHVGSDISCFEQLQEILGPFFNFMFILFTLIS